MSMPRKLSFTENEDAANLSFLWSSKDDPYLLDFCNEFSLHNEIDSAADEFTQIILICNWVHNQWKHDGWNEPTNNDPTSIVREAKLGKDFRCVE